MPGRKNEIRWIKALAFLAGAVSFLPAIWLWVIQDSPFHLEVRQQSGSHGYGELQVARADTSASTRESHRFPVRQTSEAKRYRLPLNPGEPIVAFQYRPNRANTENRIHRIRLLGPWNQEITRLPVSDLEPVPGSGATITPSGDAVFVHNDPPQGEQLLSLQLTEPLELPPQPLWTLRRIGLSIGLAVATGALTAVLLLNGLRLARRIRRRREFLTAGEKSKQTVLAVGWIGSLVILGWMAPAWFSNPSDQTELVLELKSSVEGRAQAYFDTGRGWRERYSVPFALPAGDSFRSHQVALTRRKIEALRFDPLMEEGTVWIRSARVERGGRPLIELDPERWSPNQQVAEYGWDNQNEAWRMVSVAGATDPYFLIPLEEPIGGSITFQAGFLQPVAWTLLALFLWWIAILLLRPVAESMTWQNVSQGRCLIVWLSLAIGLGAAWTWIDRNHRVWVEAWVNPSVTSTAQLRFEQGRGWEPLKRSQARLSQGKGWQRVRLFVPSGSSPLVIFSPMRTDVAVGPFETQVETIRRGWLNPWSEETDPVWMLPLHGMEEVLERVDERGQTIFRSARERGSYPDFLLALPQAPKDSPLAGPALRPGHTERHPGRTSLGLIFGILSGSVVFLGGFGLSMAVPRLRQSEAWGRIQARLERWSEAHKAIYARSRVERFFIANGLGFGLLFLVLTPPYQAPDEPRNFHRAWDVSMGNPMPTVEGEKAYGKIPFGLHLLREVHLGIALNPDVSMSGEQWQRLARVPIHPGPEDWRQLELDGWVGAYREGAADPRRMDLTDTIFLSPIPYLGSAAGIRIGEFLDDRVLTVHYLGRLGNLLLALALGVLVLRAATQFRHVLAVVMLVPMSLFLMASNSHDTVTHALGFLIFALTLRLRDREDGSLRWWHFWPFALLFPALIFSKLNYILLAPLLLLVPFRRFGGFRHWFGAFVFAGLASFVALLAWMGHYADKPASEWDRGHVDREAQREIVFQHPLYYAEFLLNSVLYQGETWFKQMIGVLGWLDTDPGIAVRGLWLLALAAAFLLDCSRWRVPWHPIERLGLIGLVLLSAVAIVTIFFLTWTEDYSLVIQGAQGRYFIPLLPWLVAALAWPRRAPVDQSVFAFYTLRLSLALCLALTAWALFDRYWA